MECPLLVGSMAPHPSVKSGPVLFARGKASKKRRLAAQNAVRLSQTDDIRQRVSVCVCVFVCVANDSASVSAISDSIDVSASYRHRQALESVDCMSILDAKSIQHTAPFYAVSILYRTTVGYSKHH